MFRVLGFQGAGPLSQRKTASLQKVLTMTLVVTSFAFFRARKQVVRIIPRAPEVVPLGLGAPPREP